MQKKPATPKRKMSNKQLLMRKIELAQKMGEKSPRVVREREYKVIKSLLTQVRIGVLAKKIKRAEKTVSRINKSTDYTHFKLLTKLEFQPKVKHTNVSIDVPPTVEEIKNHKEMVTKQSEEGARDNLISFAFVVGIGVLIILVLGFLLSGRIHL